MVTLCDQDIANIILPIGDKQLIFIFRSSLDLSHAR